MRLKPAHVGAQLTSVLAVLGYHADRNAHALIVRQAVGGNGHTDEPRAVSVVDHDAIGIGGSMRTWTCRPSGRMPPSSFAPKMRLLSLIPRLPTMRMPWPSGASSIRASSRRRSSTRITVGFMGERHIDGPQTLQTFMRALRVKFPAPHIEPALQLDGRKCGLELELRLFALAEARRERQPVLDCLAVRHVVADIGRCRLTQN